MKYFSLILVFLVCGCTQIGAFVANIPAQLSDLPRVTDQPYGPDALNTLDIYQTQPHNAPVIIFFHGGSWQTGSKDIYQFVGKRFAGLGYVVVIPDYRKFPEVKYPEFPREGAKVVHWVADHIAEYGGNPDQIILMGHSSGAHTAAILAAQESFIGQPDLIKAFVGLSGPYDFTPLAEDIKAVFADLPDYTQMQVTTFIDGGEPPFLLLHGSKDDVVSLSNFQKLKAGIEKKKGSVQSHLYNDLDHAGTVNAMTWIYKNDSPVVDDIDTFLRSVVHNQNKL